MTPIRFKGFKKKALLDGQTVHPMLVIAFSLISKGLRVLLNLIIFRKTIIKYYLEKYFVNDVQMKITNLEF